jgi:hypothetical protein
MKTTPSLAIRDSGLAGGCGARAEGALDGATPTRSGAVQMSGARSGGLLSLGLGLCSLVACGSSSPPANQVQTILATTFASDPTMQDTNADGVLDWVIRDRENEHIPEEPSFSLHDGLFRSDGGNTGGIPLDSRPRMDFPDHTELLWSARSLSNNDFVAPTVGQIYTQWGWVGSQTWINFDYDVQNAHWAAVFAMIYRRATDQVLFIVNQIDDAPGSTNLIYRIMYVQTDLPLEDFVDVKMHLYIAEKMVGVTVNGLDKGKVSYELKYEAAPKDDRMFTLFPPQGASEWKSVAVQVAAP